MGVRVVAALVAVGVGLPALVFSVGYRAWEHSHPPAGVATPAGAMTRQRDGGEPTRPLADVTARPGQPLLRTAPVTLSAPGFWSWALLDVASGTITGSDTMNRTSDTASMIKAWLAADLLRRATAQPSKSRLHQLSVMIRDSDNNAAEDVYEAEGSSASIRRLFALCGLTESRAGPGWSRTMLTARDAARMGACIADGRAAGPRWTGWLLEEMRQVRGAGRYGVIEALPAAVARQTAIKNGWLLRADGQWHVNCLAIGDGWVLAVMQRYPGRLGVRHGWAVCRSVAQQLGAAR